MKYYLTKYAISTGEIITVEGTPSEFTDGYVSVRRHSYLESFKLGRDIFETKAEALSYVSTVMIPKKVKSIEAQLKKLKGMAPTVVEQG